MSLRVLSGAIIWLMCCCGAQASVKFQVPDFFSLHIIADDMVFNGVDMSVTGFDTNKSPEDIYAFYQKAWRGRIKKSAFGDWVVYSHLKDGLLYTVQFQQEGRLKVSGTLAISNLPGLQQKQLKKLGQGFPKPAKTRVANDIKTYDGMRDSRHLLLMNKMSVASNLAFYRSALKGRGWLLQHEERNVMESDSALLFAKGSSTLNLAFTRKDGQTFIQAIRMDN